MQLFQGVAENLDPVLQRGDDVLRCHQIIDPPFGGVCNGALFGYRDGHTQPHPDFPHLHIRQTQFLRFPEGAWRG